MQEGFRVFAQKTAASAGSPWAFSAGVAFIVLWALSGPLFGYSEQWQLIVNTATTIITFLMVFIIQNTQTRDSRELHLKLDELLRAVDAARDGVIRTDDLSDEELDRLLEELQAAASPRGEAIRRSIGTRIRREWHRRPPEKRTAAHIREFYEFLESRHPRLLDFPSGSDSVKELEKILRDHVATEEQAPKERLKQ